MNGEYYYVQTKDDELMHYGVKGMHWGVRRYQPYTSNPRKGGKTGKFLGNKPKAIIKKKEGLMIPLGYDPTTLAVLGGLTALSVGVSAAKAGIKGHQAKKIAEEIKNNKLKDPKTGLKLKPREMTEKEDLKRVNPEKGSFHEGGSTSNCVRCTMAYELRRRGFDVQAAKADEGIDGSEAARKLFNAKSVQTNGYSWNELLHTTDRKKNVPVTPEFEEMEYKAQNGMNYGHWKSINQQLSKEPNSRGQMLVTWDRSGGHSFIYNVKDGQPTFMDGQTGKVLSKWQAKEYFSSSVCSSYQRLDNCKLNVKAAKDYLRADTSFGKIKGKKVG